MRLGTRSTHSSLALIVVIAVAVMSVAAFLPFLQTPCGNCLATPTLTIQESAALTQAPDAWLVLALVVLSATAAILHAVSPAPAALGCLALSCVAFAFPFVEAGSNGSLVFPGATAANPMTTEAGFYVFLLGAAIALLASLALVLLSLPRAKRSAIAGLKAPS